MLRGRSRAVGVQASGSVVVPAISAPSSTAVCRSLGKRGVRTIVVADHERAPAARSRYCDESRIISHPHRDFEGYVEALLALAARSDVRAIVPVREEDVYALSTNRDAFADHIETPWPEFETLRRVQDRLALAEAASDAGVSMPATSACTEWDRWDRPTIIKARYSLLASAFVDSLPTGIVRDVPKTVYVDPAESPDPNRFIDRMGHVPVAQEYVDDTNEYGFFALYDEGEAVATFQHRQIRGYHYCGGPSAFRESVSIPELDRAGRALLDALGWHGLAMVEFLRDESGDFRLMEVNPRFWSSLPFSVRAGADFPYYYWLLATGDRPIDPTYEVGTAGHLLRGEAIYLYSVLTDDYPLVERPRFASAVCDVIGSIVEHPRFDYLVPTDPMPFYQDLTNTLASIRGDADVLARASGRPEAADPTRPAFEADGRGDHPHQRSPDE